MNCSRVQEQALNVKLKNAFGGTSEILNIKNVYEKSRIKDKLVCIGDAKFDHGNESKLRMTVTEEDGKIWFRYSVEP